VNAAETHETVRRESGMRYQLTGSAGAACAGSSVCLYAEHSFDSSSRRPMMGMSARTSPAPAAGALRAAVRSPSSLCHGREHFGRHP
jgi:hypothetical protein